MKKFENTTIPVNSSDNHRENMYGFRRMTPYLYQWSRLFQSVISQSASFLLTGNFHNTSCAIYKCEGGCYINGFGSLVLGERSCYLDSYGSNKEKTDCESLCAKLITHVVLKWNPNDPVDSMLEAAVDFVNKHSEEPLSRLALWESISNKGEPAVFGGDALCDFFNHNPFSQTNPMTNHLDYRKFSLVDIIGLPKEEVEAQFKAEERGRELYGKMSTAIRETKGCNHAMPLCCSPRVKEDGSCVFWINTGRTTAIDGWKTEEQILQFIKDIRGGKKLLGRG